MAEPTLVVMAAGIGNRYGGLKQLDPVGPSGEFIIDYSVHDALRAGFGRVVFVVKEETEEAFREKIGRHIEGRVETAYVRQRIDDLPAGFTAPAERRKPWGTAHAVLAAKPAVRTAFAVINADDFYGSSSFAILRDRLALSAGHGGIHEYCLVGYAIEHTLTENGHVARGVCTVSPDGLLVEVTERTRIERRGGEAVYAEDGGRWTPIPAGTLVSMNMWGFTPSVFGEIEARFPAFLAQNEDRLATAEYFLPDVVTALLREGRARVKVERTGERWFGITYQQDKPLVKEAIANLVARGVYPRRLWEEH